MTTMRFLSLVGNSFGCSASGERLVSAARDGDFQEAKALLEYNPRPARYSTFGIRMHYSAAQGHHEIVSLLLESGVDINLRNYRGQIHRADYLNGGTALHLAALNGHSRCIRLLLADFLPSIPNFCSILRKKSKKDEPVLEYDEGALYEVINRPADGGVTALHMAALNGHTETVHLLLDLGASVSDITVEDGTTIDLIDVFSMCRFSGLDYHRKRKQMDPVNDSPSACLDPCVVCLERKCTVAAEGNHRWKRKPDLHCTRLSPIGSSFRSLSCKRLGRFGDESMLGEI